MEAKSSSLLTLFLTKQDLEDVIKAKNGKLQDLVLANMRMQESNSILVIEFESLKADEVIIF